MTKKQAKETKCKSSYSSTDEAINKKITQSEEEINTIQKDINDAQEDKRDAETRRTKNLQTKHG